MKHLGQHMVSDLNLRNKPVEAFEVGAGPIMEKLAAPVRAALAVHGSVMVRAGKRAILGASLQTLVEWKLDSADLSAAFSIVSHIGDDTLRSQVSFLACFHRLTIAAAQVPRLWRRTPRASRLSRRP